MAEATTLTHLLAERLLKGEPFHIFIKNLCPKLHDALYMLDDTLNWVFFCAAHPPSRHVNEEHIRTCRRLTIEWQAYVSTTSSLRKIFVSTEGIRYLAAVKGQDISWLTPHGQVEEQDEGFYDLGIMFLEFYEELLRFVHIQLYHFIGVDYPLTPETQLQAIGEELYATLKCVSIARNATAPSGGHGTLSYPTEETTDETTDEDRCRTFFRNLKFFLSHDVPKESLLFTITAFGGVVSWQGEASPFSEDDESIMLQIAEEQPQSNMFASRRYVRATWVYDSINNQFFVPTSFYLAGRKCAPHLSPFEGYEARLVHYYAHVLDNLKQQFEAKKAAEKQKKAEMLEKQYLDELKMELKGITYSKYMLAKKANTSDQEASSSEEKPFLGLDIWDEEELKRIEENIFGEEKKEADSSEEKSSSSEEEPIMNPSFTWEEEEEFSEERKWEKAALAEKERRPKKCLSLLKHPFIFHFECKREGFLQSQSTQTVSGFKF